MLVVYPAGAAFRREVNGKEEINVKDISEITKLFTRPISLPSISISLI